MRVYKIAQGHNEINDRKHGKSLFDLGQRFPQRIYRARNANALTFTNNDYVTLSYKFAKEHAEHMASVHDEDYIVISKLVPSQAIFEAYNPGEYFYIGPDIEGKEIYRAKAEDWGL